MRYRAEPLLLFVAAAIAVWLAATASSAPRIDQTTGAWRDDFRDLKGASSLRHAKMAPGAGVTIDPAEQTWAVPADARFSAGRADAGVVILAPGSAGETLTLWQRILQPGRDLTVASECAPIGTAPCPAVRGATGMANGISYPRGTAGFPYVAGGAASAAGWDTKAAPAGSPPACTMVNGSLYGGISSLDGRPILDGGRTSLAAGQLYTASFSAAAEHDGTAAPYMAFEFWNPETRQPAPGSVTVGESDLVSPVTTAFTGMTHVTVAMTAPPGQSDWEVRAVSRAGLSRHCTVLGPVYLTAQQGAWASPVLDTLSDQTAWTKVEWDIDQNAGAADPACPCPTPGSPITPVAVAWEVGTTAPASCTQAVPLPAAGTGSAPVSAAASGRYLGFCLTLFGREAAASVLPAVAPAAGALHFSGWRPVVRRVAARYYARAAEVVSKTVTPSSLRKWGTAEWEAETPGGSTCTVDVLSPDGTILFAAIPRSFPLSDALSAYRCTAVVLRARLAVDPANAGLKPVLKGWQVTWTPLGDRLALDRNAFAPDRGETVTGLVSVDRAGQVRVRVHDAAGSTVVRLLDGWGAAEAVRFTWDGRDAKGQPVAAGVYFITATTAGGAGTRKVAVLR